MAPRISTGVRSFFSSLNEFFYHIKTTIVHKTSLIPANMLPAAIKWCPTSEEELELVETELLSVITRPFKSYFVNIGPGWGLETNNIRTIELLTDSEIKSETGRKNSSNDTIVISSSSSSSDDNSNATPSESNSKQPLVLVHGFGSGVGMWILNYDFLASTIDRKIYAFDMIGFGRSTRAPFDLKADVEGQFVDAIERWREKQGIEKFILLGHSFGGYLIASYALKYPERISHIIMADPWGIQDRQDSQARTNYRFPIWVRAVNSIFQHFNPLAVLRVSGPYGPSLIHRFRGDLREKFRPKLQDNCDKFLSYLYHCNAQYATGESAFKALALPFGWPKNPLIHRLLDLDQSISLSFIYGSRSWIDKAPGEFLRDCLTPNRVSVSILQGSGHHVYADKYQEFNEIVKDVVNRLAT